MATSPSCNSSGVDGLNNEAKVSFSEGNIGVFRPNTVTQFASIEALETASESNLRTGYYEVPGPPRFITYWDGDSFDPAIPEEEP